MSFGHFINIKSLLGRQKALLSIVFIFYIFPSLAWADSYLALVYGPANYVRETAQPVFSSTSFSVPYPTGSYILLIQNSNPDSDNVKSGEQALGIVSSAVVMLNGIQVAGPEDFNKQINIIDRQVQLLAVNTLSVELRGQPGSGLTLSIIEKIECPVTGCAPHVVMPVLETQYQATSLISSMGGVINTVAGNGAVISLTIPEGALLEDKEISITPVNYISRLPLLGGMASAVLFQPEGLIFAKPVILTLDLPPEINASELFGFGWTGVGENFYLQPVSVSDNRISIILSHFSGAGAGSGDPANVEQATEGSNFLETVFMTHIISEANRLEMEICAGDPCTDEELIALNEAVQESNRNILSDWLEAMSQLAVDSRISESHLNNAFLSYTAFDAAAQSLDIDFRLSDEVNAALIEARSNIVTGAIAHFQRINDSCDVQHDINILNVLSDIQSIGEEEELARQLNTDISDLDITLGNRFGCQLIILAEGFPEEMEPNGEAAEFSINLRHRAQDLPLPEVRGTIIPGRCASVEGRTTDLLFETNNSGRFPKDPSITKEFSVTSCSEPTAIVVIEVPSQKPIRAPELAFLGKTLVLEITVIDESLRLSPTQSILEFGETVQFTAEVPGTENPTFLWEATGGTINQEGLYTAGFVPGDFLVTVTHQETGDSVSVFVTIEGTAITISPTNITLTPGETVQFSATVLGPDNTDVTWSATGGTIDNAGNYTAGNMPGNYTVTATSIGDPSAEAVSLVTITDAVVDISGTYVGTGFDFDYGECFPVRNGVCEETPVELTIDANGDQLTIHFAEDKNGVVGGTIYTAVLTGTGFNGSTDDCIRGPCEISGSIVEGVIMGEAFWQSDCPGGCFLEFTATRQP